MTRVLITGVCGFTGSSIAAALIERGGYEVAGIDNLMRPGSEINRALLRHLGVRFIHGDVRAASDFEQVAAADWVIDAAAIPNVLGGVDGASASRQVLEHNLAAIINVAEYCKRHRAGLILLSSSRVYSIARLAAIPLIESDEWFQLDLSRPLPRGLSECGINWEFSTEAPLSLYGSTKLASELLAVEYGSAFSFPVWIDRCGVLAGAGQFGTADQGIFSYWIHSHRARRPLRYIGFEGTGRQVRDAFHPRDLAALIVQQMKSTRADGRRTYTAGGGAGCAISLAQLTRWCDERFGAHKPAADPKLRRFDVPWIVMDSADAASDFDWRPMMSLTQILDEIARHAEAHPEWLELSGA